MSHNSTRSHRSSVDRSVFSDQEESLVRYSRTTSTAPSGGVQVNKELTSYDVMVRSSLNLLVLDPIHKMLRVSNVVLILAC